MKPPMLVGIVLVAVGVSILIYQGVSSLTRRDPVVKAGPVEAAGEEKDTFPIVPFVGTMALGGGIFLVVLGSSRKS